MTNPEQTPAVAQATVAENSTPQQRANALTILVNSLDAMIEADMNLHIVAQKYPDPDNLDEEGMEAMQKAFGRSSACHLDLKNSYTQLRPFILAACVLEPEKPSLILPQGL